ncbi:MAG: hypothetical protein IJ825_07315 [Oscillospiraceae bacterium]|nr:hypothetical protein [Oscillospiraceae bacterium]
MERMLLIPAFDSNETGKRADRTGNSPIKKTRHNTPMASGKFPGKARVAPSAEA